MSSGANAHTTQTIREECHPLRVAVSDLFEALQGKVSFEYQGNPRQAFRGFAIRSKTRDTRRRFWVMRDEHWTSKGVDPYEGGRAARAEDIAVAVESGAAGIVCSDSLKGDSLLEGENVFFTPDTRDFVRQVIAVLSMITPGRRTVSVTGSAGKSTTCAMVSHAISAADSARSVQQNNHNRNLIHHVLSQQSRVHRYSNTILEVAGSVFAFDHGDFSVSADVSIVTSISESHLNYLKDLRGVARYKSELFRNPPEGGLAVVNLDTPHSNILVERARTEGMRLVTYGESRSADIRLTGYDISSGRVKANVNGLDVEYTLGPKGRHMALNSLAVLATLKDLGLDWATGTASLGSFVAPHGRGQEIDVALQNGRTITLIDGSYNSNPASLRASLENMNGLPPDNRRVAVLGDILELGRESETIHRSLASDIRYARLDELHLLGHNMLKLHEEGPELARNVYLWYEVEDLINGLPATLQNGDVLLVKGSGGTGLKRLAAVLKEMR